jgi:hypothetical protein
LRRVCPRCLGCAASSWPGVKKKKKKKKKNKKKKKRRRGAEEKSNNPHLKGGEQVLMIVSKKKFFKDRTRKKSIPNSFIEINQCVATQWFFNLVLCCNWALIVINILVI